MKRLATVLLFVSSSAFAAIPFIEDDYSRAVAQAKTKKLPVFVEAWAPW